MRGKNRWRKPRIILCIILASALASIGQNSTLQNLKKYSYINSVYDYDAIHLNPANISALRVPGKKVNFGLLHFDILANNKVAKNKYLHKMDPPADPNSETPPNNQGVGILDDILKERTYMNMDITYLGLSFHTRKAGSFALSARSNIYLDGEVNGIFEKINYDGSSFSNYIEVIAKIIMENLDIGVQDTTIGKENSYLKVSQTNDINASYSRLLYKTRDLQLDGGIGVRYIMGLADVGFEFNEEEVKGYYALSSYFPVDFDGANIIANTKSNQKFGNGMGASIGTFLKYKNKLGVGISAVDMGFIKWPTKQLYITGDDAVDMAQDEAVEKADEVIDRFQRKSETKEILPAKMIISANYNVHKFVHFYLDFVSPLNKTYRNLDNPVIGVGSWLSLFNYVTLKSGVMINKKQVTLPVYLSLCAARRGVFEFSVGTADLISIFRPQREYISANAALFKFYF